MAMTIEQVRREIADMVDDYLAQKWIAAIDAHLTQPAQAVDVGLIAECAEAPRRPASVRPDLNTIADKLTRALSGEKAGPVGDGWREFIEGCANSAGGWVDGTHLAERAKCLLAGTKGATWTLDSDGHKTYWPSAEIAERERANLAILGHRATVTPPFPASPTPGKEG